MTPATSGNLIVGAQSRRFVLSATGCAAALTALVPGFAGIPASAASHPLAASASFGPHGSFPVGTFPFRLSFLPLNATMVPWSGSTDPGSIVRVWPTPHAGDAWRAVARGGVPFNDGELVAFELVNQRSGLCLTPRDPQLAPGTKLQLEPCLSGGALQQFVAVPQTAIGRPGVAYELRSRDSLDRAISVGNRSWNGSDLAFEESHTMSPGDGHLSWGVEPAN